MASLSAGVLNPVSVPLEASHSVASHCPEYSFIHVVACMFGF